MRIAEVCPYDLSVPGGVQGQVRGVADELRRRGHDVEIVGPQAAGWEWIKPIVPVPANGAVARLALGPHIRRRLLSELADFDVVHVHEPLMPTVSSAAVRTNVPVVGTLHADPAVGVRRLLSLGYGRSLLRNIEALTAVSPIAASVVGEGGARIVPNAIDERLLMPAPKEEASVLFVGRNEPRKGLRVLLEAWATVRRVRPDARLAVVSDRVSGPSDIEWLGPVDDGERIERMRRAQVLCAPHLRGESFGMVVAEGLGAGCSVVASDLPAFRWVAGDAADFIPAGDAAALANGIVDRLASPRPADEVRRRASAFRWTEVGAMYEEVLLGVRRSP